MKKLFLVTAMTVAALSVNAQSKVKPGTWSIQPKAGVTITSVTGLDDFDGLINDVAVQSESQVKVGATIGSELIMNAVMATVISWILIIAYVSYRFEWRFGVSAVLALVHDILVVLSIFSFTQKQVDSSFVAAVLTVIGYSINDTIVIFDRIRENLRLHFRKGTDLYKLANRSIYQTLTRSLYTVFTCLFTTFALYWFGGDTTKDFAFALIVGFFSGCYSSIFIASPLWVIFRTAAEKKKHAPKPAAE